MRIINTIPYISSKTVNKLHKENAKAELAREKRILANLPAINELKEQLSNLQPGEDDYYILSKIAELES